MALLKLATLSLLLLLLLLSIDVAVIGAGDVELEWQIVGSNNFTTQIRLYPHILLFITVPWCGESRSLMNEISQNMVKERDKYRSLKLMLVNRNLEKSLADSLGATEGITIFCYHHSMSYKYRGILRVPNILSSANYLLSLSADDLPLKKLSYPSDLEMFLASTDMAVVLLEFCGWTSRLLLEQNGNETLPSFAGGLSPGNPARELNQTLASGRQKYLKDVENDRNFHIQHGYGEIPWVREFSAENVTGPSVNEDVQPNLGLLCSPEEYTKFKSFFLKFMILARDIYLPPQRQKYAFVSDRSLLSTLDIKDSDQWSLIISYAGCPGCLRKINDEKLLFNAIEIHDLPVMELPDDVNGLTPALPIDKPSVVLFVDRTSEFEETRIKSDKSLHAFKELAMQLWKPSDAQKSHWARRSSHTYQGSSNILKNYRLRLSPSSQIKNKDQMSVMIINDGKQVTLSNEASNLQGGALEEILAYLARQKESKLSTLAKEAGFQLLSDEVNIKIADVSSSQEVGIQELTIKSNKVSDGKIDEKIEDFTDNVPSEDQKLPSQPTNLQDPNEYINQKTSMKPASDEFEVDPHQSPNDHNIASALDVDLKIETTTQYNYSDEKTDQSDIEHHFNAFTGSFFFCDGNYKFLKSLTNDFKLPRVVIIDPSSEQHYVLSEDADYSVYSLSTFIGGFLNGSLIPYQRSGTVRKSIEMPQPPFVNLDFHEKDSIPSVTADTFTEFVLGSSDSTAQNATNAWHKDVVLIFSTSWCGYCKRMELVVREVYRALKGYINMVDSKSNDLLSQDDWKDVTLKLPAFYLIDCTLNECRWILRSLGQKEVYPSLLLFPAERKTAIPYDGSTMVTEIIKFIAAHGTKSQHLARLKGVLWTDWAEKEKKDEYKGAFMSGDYTRSSDVKVKNVGTILQNPEVQNPVLSQLDEQASPPNPTIGSFLVATDLLNELTPFHKTGILLVRADQGVGFQGLIVNKPVSSWDSLPEFEHRKLLEGAPLSFGGPVIQHEMPLVSLTRLAFSDQHPQVLPGVYFLNQLETLGKIMEVKAGNLSASDLWFFWGYSGWSWDQLLNELGQGVWNLHEGKTEYLQWPK